VPSSAQVSGCLVQGVCIPTRLSRYGWKHFLNWYFYLVCMLICVWFCFVAQATALITVWPSLYFPRFPWRFLLIQWACPCDKMSFMNVLNWAWEGSSQHDHRHQRGQACSTRWVLLFQSTLVTSRLNVCCVMHSLVCVMDQDQQEDQDNRIIKIMLYIWGMVVLSVAAVA
jgi:hypothetical protein